MASSPRPVSVRANPRLLWACLASSSSGLSSRAFCHSGMDASYCPFFSKSDAMSKTR